MQRPIQYQTQQLERFIGQLAAFGDDFRQKVFSLEQRLSTWLGEVETYYTQDGRAATQRAEIVRLRNYLEMAARGIDPVSLEKRRTGRRELQASATFYVLDRLGSLLGLELEQLHAKLDKARDLLEPTILSAINAGLLKEQDVVKASEGLAQSAQLWGALQQHPDLQQVSRRIHLASSPQDAHLLLYELVCSL